MKSTSLAEEIANLEITAPRDYDPEDVSEPLDDREDQDEIKNGESNEAREHYVNVGKSSLRSKQFLLDDPRYSGKQTSRKDLYSSDEEEEWNTVPNAEGNPDSDSELTADDSNGDDSDNGEEPFEAESESIESAEESDKEDDENIQQELRRIEEEERAVISQMSMGSQGDIEKGKHVKQQLELWDQVLGFRIHTQKVVSIANQLPQHDTWPDFLAPETGIEECLDAAKGELRHVIDQLMDLRTALRGDFETPATADHTYNSRKRHLDDDDKYIETLWDDISSFDEAYTPFRNETLEKWSNKVQASSGVNLNKKFKALDQNIMSQINTALADKDSLIKRTQLQRSKYTILGKTQPAEEAESSDEDTRLDRHLSQYDDEIFDDHDFYQLQLRELIDSRRVDSSGPLTSGKQWSSGNDGGMKSRKKKEVERKASKGRQLRFHVHEKLQNFMAPIPAGDWHEEMIEELYSSLLGQRMAAIHDDDAQQVS